MKTIKSANGNICDVAFCIHEDGITYGVYYGFTHGSILADKTYNSKEELLKSLQK